jgi:putative transposase
VPPKSYTLIGGIFMHRKTKFSLSFKEALVKEVLSGSSGSMELSKKHDKLKGLIMHSDLGWYYQMRPYQHILEQNGVQQSMSRKGNCLDNAVIENFFGILKSELFYAKKYTSVDELKTDIQAYIEYYNNNRIKLKLNTKSPVQYRTLAA